MIKKSLIALFTSLIVSGLFLTGSVDAMTYTVSGNSTNIAIPKDNHGTTIKWCSTCSEVDIDTSDECEDTIISNVPYIVCVHNYDNPGTKTVTFNSNNSEEGVFKNLMLNNANIINISNFSTISKIYNLWINNNPNLKLNSNSFSNIIIKNISLEYDNLTGFDISIRSNDTDELDLQHNSLTTIPKEIRKLRYNYKIKLATGISHGTNTNNIDLRDNPIKFVGITQIKNSDTVYCSNYNDDEYSYDENCNFQNPGNDAYEFERFGYDYQNQNPEYSYNILYNDDDQVVNGTSGTTYSTGITENWLLKQGKYKFKVCINETETCDYIKFNVNYDEIITIELPSSGTNYTSTSITGMWYRNGYYPKDLLSGYEYTIKKDGNQIATGFIDFNETHSRDSPQYEKVNDFDIGNIIEGNVQGNTEGTYILTVKLIDKDGKYAKKLFFDNDRREYILTDITASTTFTIEANNELTITSPSHDGESISNLPMNFAWNGTGTSFSGYSYYVTTGSECSNYSNKTIEGNTGNVDVSFNQNLANGSYRLCVNMYDTSDSIIASGSRTFSVNVTSNLIITDPSGSISDLPLTFSWNSDSPSFSGYDYYVTTGYECNNSNIVSGFSGTKNNANVSFTGNLPNGSYRLCVNMHSSINNSIIASGYTNFSVNINPTLDIIKPSNTETTASTEFSWKPSINSSYSSYITNTNYTYTVKKGSETITGGTTTNTGFTMHNLRNGNYNFEVVMRYNDNGISKTVTGNKNFTMNIDETQVSITKPLTGSIITATGVTKADVEFQWSGGGTLLDHYKYSIKKSGGSEITSGTGGMTSFTTGLANGTYIFTVTGYDSSNNKLSSDSTTFKVTIVSTLKILSPSSGANLTNKSNTFTWTGFTSQNFTNYIREIKKGETQIETGTKNSISDTSTTVKNLRDGDYTFKVTMNYNGGSETAQIPFKVSASSGAFLDILSPNQPVYTGNYITTKPINFTWTGGKSALIENYQYKITNTDKNTEVTGGKVSKNSYAIPGTSRSLPSGNYKFEVTMLDDENKPIIDTKSYSFKVVIPPYLNIISPTPANVTFTGQQNINFSWSGFAEFANRNHYEWTLEKTKKGSITYTTGKTSSMTNMSATGFHLTLNNGLYKFTIKMMSGNTTIISGSRSFTILDPKDLQAYISDGNSAVNILRSTTGALIIRGNSEDFSGYYYSITGTTFTGASYSKIGTINGNKNPDIKLTNLSSGKYRFFVKMLDDAGETITSQNGNFNVEVPARLKITYPAEGATITSSSATFTWTGYSDVITRYDYKLTKNGNIIDTNNFTTTTNLTRNDLSNGNYSLTVWISSGGNLVASDTVNFTVAIPARTGGSSSKSHTTNNLNVSVANDSPTTNERVEVVVDIDDKYTGKVDFTKMQVYSGGKWIDIPITSKNYVSDYSDDAKLGYVKFSSDDDGEKELSQFIKFTQTGNYRLYAEDKDGYNDFTEFYIGNGKVTTIKSNDDDVFIARSCKKYRIIRYDSLNVYSSPNLLMNEYFVNKDYFKRYIDSKNRYQEGCPTNIGWIATSYYDSTNDNKRYTAPNGKVYFITGKEGNYYSNELNKELKTPTSFDSIAQLKTYIKDRNPLISMASLGPVF